MFYLMFYAAFNDITAHELIIQEITYKKHLLQKIHAKLQNNFKFQTDLSFESRIGDGLRRGNVRKFRCCELRGRQNNFEAISGDNSW